MPYPKYRDDGHVPRSLQGLKVRVARVCRLRRSRAPPRQPRQEFKSNCVSCILENPPFKPHRCELLPGSKLPPASLNERDVAALMHGDRQQQPRFGHAPSFQNDRNRWEGQESSRGSQHFTGQYNTQGRGRVPPSAARMANHYLAGARSCVPTPPPPPTAPRPSLRA
jgi:hypothetical protein